VSRTGEITRLVERLTQAEADLAAAMAGEVDSIVDPEGHSYLLRAAQQALRLSEARAKEQAALLSAIFDSAPDFITYVGIDRRIRYSNKVLPDLAPSDLIGTDWISLQLPDQQDALRRVFDAVVSSGEPGSYEGPGRGADGTVAHYSRRLGCVRRDGEVVGVAIVTRDITHQKATEAQLLTSDRMASVGLLAAGIAHEINNPLASVIANLDCAVQDLKTVGERSTLPRDLEEEIVDAREAADRVRMIVRDLKIFSRTEDDRREAVDVQRVMESTLRMAWNEIRHRSRLVKEYGRVPLVQANESRLGQVFLNLVVNAAQSIPEGNAAGNLIRISTFIDGAGRVGVSVSDTGGGIPPHVQQRLFTPFFTTKPVGAGTGLGLSICQRLVTSFGGEITFKSEVGKGTEFRLSLPVALFEDAPTAEQPKAAVQASRRGRILIVDDDATVGRAARRILALEHDVTVFDDAKHALETIRSGERFDVVLCDLMMPQMTGMDLHATLQESDPEQAARFIFVTGGAFTARAREFLDVVRNHRVEKPFDPQGLRVLVNGLIGAR
jgi:PAS domain S-box-containing protein